MSKATKLKSRFNSGTQFKPKADMSHDIYIYRKLPNPDKPSSQKHTKDWFFKPETAADAIREVIAQEFFRLMIPGHPKTRLVYDDKTKETFVASQEIKNPIFLDAIPPADFKSRVLSGNYTGLGHLCVMALFMNEIDFKTGNILVHKDNTSGISSFKKLDGGWSFAGLIEALQDAMGKTPKQPLKYKITENMIANLPYKSGYSANWFEENKTDPEIASTFLDPAMIYDPKFRKEVNEQILKILLMPDKLLHLFVSAYTSHPNHVKELTDFLIERKIQMHKAAMKNASFVAYLGSNAATLTCQRFKTESLGFMTSSKNPLVDKAHQNLIAESIDLHWSALELESLLPISYDVEFTATQSDPLLNPPKREDSPLKSFGDNAIYSLKMKDFHKVQVQFTSTKILGFFTRAPDEAVKALSQQIQQAPDDLERWKLAYKFIHQHPDNPFTKYLKKELETIKTPAIRRPHLP